jgi:translation initiation factor eIF-2B subunit beta
LKAAVDKKLHFTVVICEGAPGYQGHDMAQFLAQAGIEVICITDSALFAMMARVNKVLLPAHAVLANGGLVAPSGCNLVALAAAQNSVPVVCLTGMFKLTPLFPHNEQDTLNDLLAPTVDYAQYHKEFAGVDIVNPVHDYIKPELIKLYVTNVGSFQPSYIYRLLAEYYHSDDWKDFQ